MTTPAARRRFLNQVLPWPVGLMLAGCGFKLRQAPDLQFKTIALKGFNQRSLLAEELRLHLNGSKTTQVVESLSSAQVVFEALHDLRERVVTANTAAGQVRTFQLRTRLKFQLLTPSGTMLLPPSEITLMRDMSYNESLALAKEQEEAELFKAMQSDIIAQVMRRLATVTLPPA